MKQSKELRNFYRKVYKWMKNGAKEGKPFYRDNGLCSMFWDYDEDEAVFDEMQEQFKIARLDIEYPFGKCEYEQRLFNSTQYKDKNRVRWVKKHLKRNVKKKFKLK